MAAAAAAMAVPPIPVKCTDLISDENMAWKNSRQEAKAQRFLTTNPSAQTAGVDLMKQWTRPVNQPEEGNRQQEADEHRQAGPKPDLLLMRGQTSFSPVSTVACHKFGIYMPGSSRIVSPYFVKSCAD
jgi:hypothetical protein